MPVTLIFDQSGKLAYRHFGSPIMARWFRFGEPAEKLKAMLEVNSGAGFVFNRSSGGKPAFPTCEYAGGEFSICRCWRRAGS